MLAKIQLTTHLLGSARYLAVFNLALFFVSAQVGGSLFSLQILLLCLLMYWQLRVYIDYKLFQDLAAQRYDLAALDEALQALNLQKNRPNRPLVARSQAALRYWKYSLRATLAQALLLFLQA